MSFVETMIPPQAPPPAPPKPYTLARFVGSVTLGIWLALGVGVFLTVVNGWDPAKFAKYGPSFLSGLGVTLMLVACSVVLGALLSLPVALGRMSKNKIWSWLAYGYVYFFRGTPLIAQLFLIYYGLGSFRPQLESVGLWWFFREAWNCALFTFTLTPPPTRRKSCAARSRACRAVSAKVQPPSGCRSASLSTRSSCRRR